MNNDVSQERLYGFLQEVVKSIKYRFDNFGTNEKEFRSGMEFGLRMAYDILRNRLVTELGFDDKEFKEIGLPEDIGQVNY